LITVLAVRELPIQLPGRRLIVPPAMVLAMPPSSIQIALLVGAPVKKREKSEPNELDALIPKIIRTIPRASSAIPNGFIGLMFVILFGQIISRTFLQR
jgi:hypothetical protein